MRYMLVAYDSTQFDFHFFLEHVAKALQSQCCPHVTMGDLEAIKRYIKFLETETGEPNANDNTGSSAKFG